MTPNVKSELERLLQAGEKTRGQVESPVAWEAEVQQLIDIYLGPKTAPPPNAHSDEYYNFIFARSHDARLAILGNILRFATPGDKKNLAGSIEAAETNSSVDEPSKGHGLDATQLVVAVIGALGVIGAAVIAAWFAK